MIFRLLPLYFLHSLEGSVLCSSVSTNCLHVFLQCSVCCSGDLGVYLLQGGRGGISGYEVVSCSHYFQYFRWNGSVLIRCRHAAFRRMVRKIFSPFWQFVGSRLLLSLSSISLRYRSQFDFFKLKLVRCGGLVCL